MIFVGKDWLFAMTSSILTMVNVQEKSNKSQKTYNKPREISVRVLIENAIAEIQVVAGRIGLQEAK